MKKIIFVILIFIISSCDEYKKGFFISLYNGNYSAQYIVNKKTNQQIDLSKNKNFNKYLFEGERVIIIDTFGIERKFNKKPNYDLIDRNSKNPIWQKEVYYNLIDSLSFEEYSLRVRGINMDGQSDSQIEISNLIKGKFDAAKDTLIYKCIKVN